MFIIHRMKFSGMLTIETLVRFAGQLNTSLY